MFNRKSQIENRKSARQPRAAFTLVEILVAVGVLSILGVALVGLMMAGVGAWRDGEAARQVQEKILALKRQIADDFAAAILDPPPTPDFHYVLDTLADLPTDPTDPYCITSSTPAHVTSPQGTDLWYFGSGQIDLKIRVPFAVGAALLSARLDVLDKSSDVRLQVARNDPTAADPTLPVAWQDVEWLNQNHDHDGAIGGAETDISTLVVGGDTIFIRAVLAGGNAQFLRADTLRAEGRPVLILDCYRDPNALPQRARPVFKAYFENGAQVLVITRTIPGETEKAIYRDAGTGPCTEYLNNYDDNGDGYADEPANLKPLGGRASVVYRFEPYPPEMGKPGLGVLKRGFEAPLGRTIDQIPTLELIPNVAYFGVSFWGGGTTVWEPNPELDPNYNQANPPHPACQRWLSSRYMPEQVQVTLVLEPDGGRRTTTALAAPVASAFPQTDNEADRMLLVDNTRGFYNVARTSDTTQTFLRDPRHYIKIGSEWIFYERVASPAAFLIPKTTGRGQRGTTPRDWPQQAEVLRGITSVFTVPIPAFRNWQR